MLIYLHMDLYRVFGNAQFSKFKSFFHVLKHQIQEFLKLILKTCKFLTL